MPIWRRSTPARLIACGGVAALALAVMLPGTAQAAPADRLAPLHPAAGDVVKGSYIVVYSGATTPEMKSKVESGVRSAGGQIGRRYTAGLPGFAATLPSAALDQVRRDPSVAYVEPNAVIRLDATASWGIDRINQRQRPVDGVYGNGANGAAVHAYVIDSGVRTTHVEFGGRATADANFVADGRNDDCLGHGTHVAGTVGGATVGVAHSVRIHAVRVFGCSPFGNLADIIAGINWVTANAQRPAVINMSLGGGANQALDDATNAAINAGITVAVAAGNSGSNACNASPARVPRALTVANSTQSDARNVDPLGPSSFGPCVDLFAPGTDIISASNANDTGTRPDTGTSMASPHVAGVAALYLSRHPLATPQQVHDVIVRTATVGVISDPQGSPNRLLYSTFDSKSDYNADGTSDIAVWRPSTGTWFVRNIATVQWGGLGDIPVPADYNGDGATDYAVWRPSTGTWFVRNIATVQWGALGDIPVPADYNHDGAIDLAVWRPSTGTWWILGIGVFQWGQSGDIPVPGDYNGDGATDLTVWRPSTGTWFILNVATGAWGMNGDFPVMQDSNGDGAADLTVWRPSNGTWFSAFISTIQWGQAGDIPAPADFNGDGLDDTTVWRPSNGTWFLRNIATIAWGGLGDIPV